MDEHVDDLIGRLRQRIEMLETQLGKARVGVHDRDEFLRRAFEDAPIGMALVGLDDRIVEANAALCQMLGYTREQLLQKTVPEITHPDDVITEATPRGEMEDGTATSFVLEKRYVRADGSMMVGRLSVSALFDEHARPAYFIGQLEDVTRERAAEDALREREALFRALIESTTEIFCVVDVDGVIRFVSPTVAGLGWTPGEQIGRSFESLILPHESFAAAFAEVVEDPSKVLRTSVRIRRRDGSERHFDLVGRNRLDVEAIAGVVITLRDVTDQLALQTQLGQAQRLDSLARLVGGVAHDFNNLLGVIVGTTDLLAMDLAADDPRRDDIETIATTAERASALTRQLLAFGRRGHAAPQAIDVHLVLERARTLLERLLGDDVTLEVELDAESGWVVIDPTQVEQVVLNFATNARDAMPTGGRFRLRTRTRTLDHDDAPPPLRPGRYVELEAADTGVGIDAELREHIFDPFFTTKQSGRGTGLGLATVYGIVSQAGGHISLDSELGRGARFTILWPEAARAEAPVELAPIERARVGAHVLVVEDEPGVRQVIERTLARGGYQVTAAADPAEALALARTDMKIDIIVTDVVMPQMSGPELIAQLIELRGELPVVFVSGYAKAAHSELSGHPGFLAKPFTPAMLLAKVAERLRAGREAATSR
ncbi:MAG TPA: PAS domain S-box protein [Enhygromyxa sp.]|nr:PAS domain S-box protein [Enhygromyxa sp.]